MRSGKRKAKGIGAAAKTAKQSHLEQMLPLLKKPLEVVGEAIKVPGAFWEGSMTEDEKKELYICNVRDFSALHTFTGGMKGQGFELQEMGKTGTGSLEHGDASGEIFWMKYPFPVCASLACFMSLCVMPEFHCLLDSSPFPATSKCIICWLVASHSQRRASALYAGSWDGRTDV